MNVDNLRKIIFAIALENAVLHKGKARSEPVIGKIISIRPELREKIKELISIVNNIVAEVNSFPLDDQIRLFEEYSEYLPERKVKRREKLPPLPNASKGNVVTRFSPNPDFVLHLGSARAAILSHDYARMYDGKFILRFEDTDPRTKKPRLEYYDAIRTDLSWLGCKWDEEYIQSLRLTLYYDVARKLIELGKAYVCICERGFFKKRILSKKPCPCRNLSINEHVSRFDMMLSGEYKEGEAVLRIKTDLAHPNPSMRDWPALRIIDTNRYPHPLTGSRFRVWPLYNFSCAVDDHYMGITHVIRGAEHKVNELRQRYIYEYMGWKEPTMIHHGKLGVAGKVLSKSKILAGIKSGIYKGFDDPRVVTLASLRRRGFQPEAIRRIIHEVGLKPSTAIIDWKTLETYNRRIVDPIANRRMVVLKPLLLYVTGLEGEMRAEMSLHPDFPERGKRVFKIRPVNGVFKIYVEERDIKEAGLKRPLRLMGLANIVLERIEEDRCYARVIGLDVPQARRIGAQFIHWVPYTDNVQVKLIWSDASEIDCLGEIGLADEDVGAIIQMERVGYARIERKDENWVQMIYLHR
ncbi:glutamate--tRNA ligase [Candidatus Geothermarchaeota archaeon]|nr:MAG: glutamate--tRNA ligase [Candidatus Geothermarchaeota archaeon]